MYLTPSIEEVVNIFHVSKNILLQDFNILKPATEDLVGNILFILVEEEDDTIFNIDGVKAIIGGILNDDVLTLTYFKGETDNLDILTTQLNKDYKGTIHEH